MHAARFRVSGMKLYLVLMTVGVAVAGIGFQYLIDYRDRLAHVRNMIATAVSNEMVYHLAVDTGGDLDRISPADLRAIIRNHISMPDLPVFAVLRDARGRVIDATGLGPEELALAEGIDRAVNHQFVERGGLLMYSARLDDTRAVAIGFAKSDVALIAARGTALIAAFVAALLVGYFVLVFRRIRQEVETPLKRFFDDRLNENVHSIVAGAPRRQQHAEEESLDFLPPALRKRVGQSLALLDLWAQHKRNIDRFIGLSILEVDKRDLIHSLHHTLGTEFPVASLVVFEINRSQNRLEPIYASRDLNPGEEALIAEPRTCRAFRSGRALSQTADERLCQACGKSDTGPVLCVPLIAGSTEIGICKLALDAGRLADYWPMIDEPSEKLTVITGFLTPYLNLASLTLSNLNLLDAYKNQALTDALTGLYNRRYLVEYMVGVLNLHKRSQSNLSVFMMDVDNFKRLNDEFGHKVGDMVLTKIAAAVRAGVRESDVVGRYGGEEFIAVLPHTDRTDAVEVAERVRLNVAEIEWDKEGLGNIPRVTISIGVAEFPIHGYSHYHLANAADRALYRAKRAGKNRVVLHEALPDEADETIAHA